SPSTFAVAGSGVQGGTTIRFRLSASATVKITIARRLTGRISHHHCVKATTRLAKRPACIRLVPAGKLVRAHVRAGRHNVAFSGRLGRRVLGPGRYRAGVVAIDRRHHESQEKSATFTIVPRSTEPSSPADRKSVV